MEQNLLLISTLMLFAGLYLLGARWYLFLLVAVYIAVALYGKGFFGA
jgi:hypothetical protein